MSQPLVGVDASALDLDALSSYLVRNNLVAQSALPLSAKRFSLGTSNPTFLVETANGRKLVIRRKPMGQLLKGDFFLVKNLRPASIPPFTDTH